MNSLTSNFLHSQQQFIDQMPGLLVALDRDSKFLTANKTALQWTGFKSHEALLQKTYADMPCKASEQHEAFIEQDKIIFSRDGYGKILGLYCYNNDDWKVILAEKYPLMVDDKITAIISYITDITQIHMIDMMKFLRMTNGGKSKKLILQQKGYLIEEPSKNSLFTIRELECLFYFIRGKSCSDIAKLFFLSKRTVEKHLHNIKNKFNCSTKSELIEKALSEGYLNKIPSTLLSLIP